MRRKHSGLDGAPPSNRLRLSIVLAALAAFFMFATASAASAANNVHVKLEGTGSGEVFGVEPSPGTPPIACHTPVPGAGTCEAEVPIVEESHIGVNLEAKAPSGSAFVKWTVVKGTKFPNTCETHPNCTVFSFNTASQLEVKAEFEATKPPPNVHVLIEGSGSGKVTGNAFLPGVPPVACEYASPGPTTGVCDTYAQAKLGVEGVKLDQLAAPGSEFAGWTLVKGTSPSCEGTNPSCTALLEEPPEGEVVVKAVFNLEPAGPEGPPLTLKVEEGQGTVVSNPAGLECTGTAPHECTTEEIEAGKVVLTASPAAGYAFKSWKGCDVGGVNGRQCTVTLAEPGKTVGAKFYKTWNLTGTKSNPNGIFSTAPGGVNCGYGCISSSAAYKEGALTLKAKPAKNFHFVEFKGGTGSAASCNGVTAETCAIAAFSSDSSIEEVYLENAKHTLTLTKEGGGQGFIKTKPTNINCGYTCTAASAEFFAAETVPVTVTLNKGTTQVTWTTSAGTCTANALSCEVPMSASHTLVAKFE